MAGAPCGLKGMALYCQWLRSVLNEFFFPCLRHACHLPVPFCIDPKRVLPSCLTSSSTHGSGHASNLEIWFSRRKSLQKWSIPSGLGTAVIGLAQGLVESSIMPARNILSTSALIARWRASIYLYFFLNTAFKTQCSNTFWIYLRLD